MGDSAMGTSSGLARRPSWREPQIADHLIGELRGEKIGRRLAGYGVELDDVAPDDLPSLADGSQKLEPLLPGQASRLGGSNPGYIGGLERIALDRDVHRVSKLGRARSHRQARRADRAGARDRRPRAAFVSGLAG